MCTLTWRRDSLGYTILFNRDERNARLPALPPRLEHAGIRWIGPVDGDHGGTWIAVNERGVTVGLMNGIFEERAAVSEPRSRGLLVRDLAGAESLASLEEEVEAMDLTTYRPFRFFALAPEAPFLFAEWNGRVLKMRRDPKPAPPIVSSFFEESEVGRRRRADYDRLVGATDNPPVERLEAYHRSHFPERSPYSVCMHREEARTQSLTRVDVTAERARMLYHAGPPCENAPEFEVALARVEAGL
jgi:hypothetical protein